MRFVLQHLVQSFFFQFKSLLLTRHSERNCIRYWHFCFYVDANYFGQCLLHHAGFARRLGLADPQVYLSSRQQLSIECWMYEVWCDSCVKLCGGARGTGAKQLYSLLFIRQWASQEHWARAYAPHLAKRCLIFVHDPRSFFTTISSQHLVFTVVEKRKRAFI